MNMRKSAWIFFALHFFIVIPRLREGVVTYFNSFLQN